MTHPLRWLLPLAFVHPLAAADEAARVASLAACPPTGLCVVEKRTRYPLDARSVQRLVQAIEDGGVPFGDSRAHALADLDLAVVYVPLEGSAGCRLDGLAVRLEVELLLPAFIEGTRGSEQLRDQARMIAAGLLQHENGHAHIAMQHSHALLADLLSLPPAEDCGRLRDIANSLQLRHSLRHGLAQQRYDARTRHGATQGAVVELHRHELGRKVLYSRNGRGGL